MNLRLLPAIFFNFRLKIFISLLILFVGFAGCAEVEHLDQLLTLKAASDNRDLQEKYVQERNKNLKALLEAIDNNNISENFDQKKILENFGEPIFIKQITENGQAYERWLYHDAAKFTATEKVYLYFDPAGKLARWEHIKPPPKEEKVKESSPVNNPVQPSVLKEQNAENQDRKN